MKIHSASSGEPARSLAGSPGHSSAVPAAGSRAAPKTGDTPLPHGPGFATLVRIHLRALWGEFPMVWIALGGLAVALPVIVAFHSGTTIDLVDLPAAVLTAVWLNILLYFLTVAVVFLWPDAVWRSLPPGGRSVLDALPVGRRTHRMARVTAGLVLPIAMAVSVGAAAALFLSQPELPHWALALGGSESGLGGHVAVLLSLTAAYFLTSALAIRFGRVLLALLLLVAGGAVAIFLLMAVGWDGGARALQLGLFQGRWAPGRSLVLAFSARPSDLWPALLWCVLSLGLCTYWAGRHDRP